MVELSQNRWRKVSFGLCFIVFSREASTCATLPLGTFNILALCLPLCVHWEAFQFPSASSPPFHYFSLCFCLYFFCLLCSPTSSLFISTLIWHLLLLVFLALLFIIICYFLGMRNMAGNKTHKICILTNLMLSGMPLRNIQWWALQKSNFNWLKRGQGVEWNPLMT